MWSKLEPAPQWAPDWYNAKTLVKAAELAALCHEGKATGVIPAWAGPEESECPEQMRGVLADLGRIGILLHTAEYGVDPHESDGAMWMTRNAIAGFTDPHTAKELTTAACNAGLLASARARHPWLSSLNTHIPFRSTVVRRGVRVVAARCMISPAREWDTVAVAGCAWSRRDIAREYRGLHADLIADLSRSVQVCLAAPREGAYDEFWRFLQMHTTVGFCPPSRS